MTEAQGVASCSRDRTGPYGYNQNKEAHWGKHNKNISPSAAFALKGNLQFHLNSAVFQQCYPTLLYNSNDVLNELWGPGKMFLLIMKTVDIVLEIQQEQTKFMVTEETS